jgi:hypothetical protein
MTWQPDATSVIICYHSGVKQRLICGTRKEAMKIFRNITESMSMGYPLVIIEDENDAAAFATAAIASASVGVSVELLLVTDPTQVPAGQAETIMMSRAN